MIYRAATLFELGSEHAYFGTAEADYLRWEPTVESVAALNRNRLLFRNIPNGAVVLYEVDTSQSDSHALIPLDTELELVLVGRPREAAFTGYTDLPFERGHIFVFSNRRGHFDGGQLRLYASVTAGLEERARLTPVHTALRYTTPASQPRLTITSAAGRLVLDEPVASRDGAVERFVDLSSVGPGLFSIALDGVEQEQIYADSQLWTDPPVAVVILVARTGAVAGLEIVTGDGQPLNAAPQFRIAFAARSTIWRYVVVPRSDPALDEDLLEVEDSVLEGGAPRFAFNVIGPKAPTTTGEEAVVFESTAPIGFRSTPYQGLRLRRRTEPAEPFVNAISDLPNPPAGALGLTTTTTRPVSEVFVYV